MTEIWVFATCPNRNEPPESVSYLNTYVSMPRTQEHVLTHTPKILIKGVHATTCYRYLVLLMPWMDWHGISNRPLVTGTHPIQASPPWWVFNYSCRSNLCLRITWGMAERRIVSKRDWVRYILWTHGIQKGRYRIYNKCRKYIILDRDRHACLFRSSYYYANKEGQLDGLNRVS